MKYELERSVGIETVLKACQVSEQIRSNFSLGDTIDKEDLSPVTVADYCAQAVINLELMKTFDEPIMAEEDSSILISPEGKAIKQKVLEVVNEIHPDLSEDQILSAINNSKHEGGRHGRFWAVDPIDGTKGYIRGEQYAIALALIEEGEVVVGVLGCPNLNTYLDKPDISKGSIFIGVKGQGTSMRTLEDANEISVKVTSISDPRLAMMCESLESSHSSQIDSEKLREILNMSTRPIRVDSQCKYGLVARGDASIYWRIPKGFKYIEKVWDHAAGWLIVKEAGGHVTDVFGNPLDFSVGRSLERNSGIVATSGKIHSDVISAIKQVLDIASGPK